jgi:rhamnosyl/mannosyltransferase
MPLSLSQPLILAQLKPDILHIHSPYPLGEAANWLCGRARAAVITHHSDIVRQKSWLRLYGPLLRRVLQHTDRIIATSPRYIESSPWLQPVSHKCTVIPLGVDLTRFNPTDCARTGPLQLLFVGKLRYYKGLDTLLHALATIPNTRLTVVGTGPMQAAWTALTRDLGLTERVTFAGEVDEADLPAQYQQADLFVLPANARAEAFGTVLLEAMASGLPCLTTELGTGTSWIVQDGVTGLVVPPQNPSALAQAIRTLQSNESLRRQMGQAGLARVRAEFSQEMMVSRVMQVYTEVLAQSRK